MVKNVIKRILNLICGFSILILLYFFSFIIVKFLHISLPPAILGLVLFAIFLIQGIIKEEWVKDTCDILIKNMAMFLLPFMGALVVYKSILEKNWFVIFLVIFLATSLTIVLTGLFVEWGVIFLSKHNIKNFRKDRVSND